MKTHEAGSDEHTTTIYESPLISHMTQLLRNHWLGLLWTPGRIIWRNHDCTEQFCSYSSTGVGVPVPPRYLI